MKKIIFALALTFSVFNASLFAQNAENDKNKLNEVAVEYTNWIFEKSKWYTETNEDKLHELSGYLTPEQRTFFYEENEKSGVKPFLLNLLVGFGVGSFVQDDRGMGTLQLIGSTLGLGLLIGGSAWNISSVIEKQEFVFVPGAIVMIGIGSFVQFVSLTIGCIRPWILAHNRNSKLRKILCVDEKNTGISFSPIISPVENEYGFMAKISF